MAKKGKEGAKGGKRKEVKKGKKELVSLPDDGSDADRPKDNPEESEGAEGEGDGRQDPPKKKGKEKRGGAKGKQGPLGEGGGEDASAKAKRQLKGASKAVMGLAADDAKKKKAAKKEHAKAQLKGATKAMAMAKKEPAAPPKKKRSLKSTSRLFMGVKGLGPKKTAKKSHFKNASHFFWGLKQHSTKKKKQQQKNKGVLKSTSNLMLRFKELGTNKRRKAATAGSEAKKPSFLLIRLGGGKAEDPPHKGAGGFLGSLFRRRKTSPKFKPQARAVSRVAAVTSWLTRKFLSKRGGYRYDKGGTDESWLSRIGAKKLPFPSGEEVLRHRANMRRIPGACTSYGQIQEEFDNWGKWDPASTQDYSEEDRYYNASVSSVYGFPNYDQGCYGRNPAAGEYGPYDEAVGYYEEDPTEHQGNYTEYGPLGRHRPCDSYGDFCGEYEVDGGPYVPHYIGTGELGYLEEEEEAEEEEEEEEVNDWEQEWVSQAQASYNPYACPLEVPDEMDEAESEDCAAPPSSPSPFYQPQGVGAKTAGQLPLSRKFRLFPRPQVKLFGEERLDIWLPPSPEHSLADLDPEEEQREPPDSPFAQLGGSYLEPPSSLGISSKLSVSQLQRPLATNLARRKWALDPSQAEPGLSPRESGSPLGQIPLTSFSQPKPILKPHAWGRERPPTPAPFRRGMASQVGKSRPLGPPSPPQLPGRTFERPRPTFSPSNRRQLRDPEKHNTIFLPSHPSVRLREALHEELQSTLPLIRSSSNRKSFQSLSFARRKGSPSAANEAGSPHLSHGHPSPSSLKQHMRSFGSQHQAIDIPDPEITNPSQHFPEDQMFQQRSNSGSAIGYESSHLTTSGHASKAPHLKRIISTPAKENPVPWWGQMTTMIENPSNLQPPSLPGPSACSHCGSQYNTSSSSLGSMKSLRDIPFSRSLFHTSRSLECDDSAQNRTTGRFVPRGFCNPTSRSLNDPPSPQPSLRHFGSPPVPNHLQASTDARRSLPQAWNQQAEPPSKAVKPVMRNQHRRLFGLQSPVLSTRSSPHLTHQRSHRVSIRESPMGSHLDAHLPYETDGPEEAQWQPQARWDCPAGDGMATRWDSSLKTEATRTLRGDSDFPQPSNWAPSTPKPFLQHIGHPLVGMAKTAASVQFPSVETPGRLEYGTPYLAELGQPPGQARAFPRDHFHQHSPALVASMKQKTQPVPLRYSSPKLGHNLSGGKLSYAIPGDNPSNFGRPNLSSLSQRMVSFKRPHLMGRESPFLTTPSSFHHQSGKPRRLNSAHVANKLLEREMEDGMGRYAVVMPQVQVQRMGSSAWRTSQRQKQSWSDYRTVNVQEMPSEWASKKLFQQQASHPGGRGGGGKGRGNGVFWYLTRGVSGPHSEYGESKRNLQRKMHSIHSLQSATKPGQLANSDVDDLTQLEDRTLAQDQRGFFRRFTQGLDYPGPLAKLQLEKDLQESVVLHNIRRRFDRGVIYTYIGSILVSVNPYKMFNIYGPDHVLKYEGKALGENPPHLFAIANVAYGKLRDAKFNQCIIISGESGSGKTEATKLILHYLAAISQRHAATQQILEATPLLESFGNAKTVRNDNSSRFGKFVEIFLKEDGSICGAITSQYLLEKSRVIFQAKNERNYHVFYEMLAGLPTQQKQMFCLQSAETYYYLNQGGNCEIPGKVDLEDFHRLLDTMEVLHVSPQDQDSIFRILSSILHLGNIYFEKSETDCQEVASVVSTREIRVVAELLQISPEALQRSITYKVTETKREKIFTALTVESAVDARDAIAKILYSLLFNWITDRINKQIYPKQNTLSIAILDIYGFEDLGFNSFEQLCINYANEYLQLFFNKIVFKEEQEEYIREQIEWREIAFRDNQSCIELISQKPYGILKILDDQSSFPQATDHSFLQKCHYHHGSSPLYSKPKMPLPEFSIRHYAGKVTYQVHKFLDKNYDQVRQDVLDLFVNSKIKMVAGLFFSHAQAVAQRRTMVGKSSTCKRKQKPQTVAAKFQQSLLDLLEKMERCNPFFIRCIKPNSKKEPGLFEADIVSSQLRSSGILETIRIRKEGFPVRIPFQIFIDRYRCLVDIRADIVPDGWNAVGVLKKLCPVTPEMYCLGATKLFMKENVYQQLEAKRERIIHLAVVTLQRYTRGFLIKKRFHALRGKIILLQARARGFLVRQKYWRLRRTLIQFRCLVRIYVNCRRYLRRKEEERRIAEEKRKAEQELNQREIMKVSHLEIPAELVGLLNTVAAHKQVNQGCVAPVPPPKMEADTQLALPLDINNYPIAKYVQLHFKEPFFGMLTRTLTSPLTQLDASLAPEALSIFKLILRFMGDAHLSGTQEILFGNYIVQKGLSMPRLRDEILAQIANQVWRNTNIHNEEQGWLLLASCSSAFAPSSQLDQYLLKFVSDYALDGYKALCQQKLLQAMASGREGAEAARAFPPTLLEWTASRDCMNMALDVYCFNGDRVSCPVHSWITGESLAVHVLKDRGLTEGWQGWSVSLKDGPRWAELAGQDYVLDLISNLELIRGFPKQKSSFVLPSEGPEKNAGGKLPFQCGLESDERVPPPPLMKAPTVASASLPGSSERYCSHDSDTISEPQSQKGMDRYLESLFDPVLSYGNGELEEAAAISRRMKGGGQAAGGTGDDGVPQASELQAGNLVRHSKLNSEHNPEPTQNIRNIIKQYQPPAQVPEPVRKEGRKVFVKKMDPHEEALLILKGRMAAAEGPGPPTQVFQEAAPRQTIALVKPVASAKAAVAPAVAKSFLEASPAVAISRELALEDGQVQTRLHRQGSKEFYGYHNVPWKIYLRKEVFYPKENISSPLLLDLLFRQILSDTLSDTCPRLTEGEKLHMKALLEENKLDPLCPVAEKRVKEEIVRVARESWEVYFSRLFPATGSVGTGVQILAVSDGGIKLLRLVRGANLLGEQVRVLRGYSYKELLFVDLPSKNMLEFNLLHEKLLLFSPRAGQVKALVDYFLLELKKDSEFMVAIKNHLTNDESFLNFHKGDIICLHPMEGLASDHCYGCVVRKKVMLLEEVQKGALDFGWKFGAIYGKPGIFPASYVQPVAAPDFLQLPAEKRDEPKDKQAKVTLPASVAVAVASAAVAQELDKKAEVSPASNEYQEEFETTPQSRSRDGPFTMLEFARKYFRQGPRAKAAKEKSKKGVESKSMAESLQFTKFPIQKSLLEFTNGSLNKIAAETFQAVMKFMGDLPLKGQTEQDVVYSLLQLCGDHEVIRDEVFCQIIKQITDNVSSKTDSCQRGWRLLYILSAYYRCSEVLKPYLLQFLQEICCSPGFHFQGIAKACEQNLQKTFRFGGRCEFPSNAELHAVLVGRSSKRQRFLLPGGIERHLKIKTCSVAQDVIEEICFEMGLHQPEAVREYIIFAVSNRNWNVRPLDKREYILDVTMEMENVDSGYMFWYRRVIWTQPLKFDNQLYVTMHYNQVLPDYLKGLFHTLPSGKASEQQFQQLSKLAALQLRIKALPTLQDIQDYIPPQFYRLQKAQTWLDMVSPYLHQAQALSPHQARAQFLGLLSALPLFGSSFFYIQSCHNSTILAPCILAVNQNGLNFLNKETHEPLVTFSLKEVQSTRTQRPSAGSSYPSVEIMLGDLISQRSAHLQLEQGLELCRVIATHVESLLQAREKQLTLPPSEITLL